MNNNTTDIKFFTNEENSTLLSRFKNTLKDSQYFDILVGYFRLSGFHQLYDSFEKIEKTRILVGLNVDKATYDIIMQNQENGLIDFESDKPIFVQIAEWLEDAILSNAFEEESQIPSITEISVMCKINPATALKGINMLVDKEIVYKKRGLGMFVKEGAVKKLMKERKNMFYESYIEALLDEAKKLNLNKEDIIEMIERGYSK